MLRRSSRSAGIAPQGNEDADHGVEPKTGVEALGQPEARGRRRSNDVAGVGEATAGEEDEMWRSGAEDGDRTVAGLGAELGGDQFDRDGDTSKEPTLQGMHGAIFLAKHNQDRIADALSREALPLFIYYGIVRLAEEFASEWGGPHLVHRAEKLVSSASTGTVCRIGDRPRSPPKCAGWEALMRRLADGTTAVDAVEPAKAATRVFYLGGIAEPSIDQSGGRSTSSGPDCSFIGLSVESVAQKLRTMGRGNVTARSCGSSGVTIAWCPGYGAVGNWWRGSGAAKRPREPGGSMCLTAKMKEIKALIFPDHPTHPA